MTYGEGVVYKQYYLRFISNKLLIRTVPSTVGNVL
jgi:hypothetical protein